MKNRGKRRIYSYGGIICRALTRMIDDVRECEAARGARGGRSVTKIARGSNM